MKTKKNSSLQNKWVFGPKVCEDQKKGLRLKISGFFVQMRMGTTKQSEKSKVFTTNHHNMVSPQNGDTRGGPLIPLLATPLWREAADSTTVPILQELDQGHFAASH